MGSSLPSNKRNLPPEPHPTRSCNHKASQVNTRFSIVEKKIKREKLLVDSLSRTISMWGSWKRNLGGKRFNLAFSSCELRVHQA